jgi:hypothetical protein
MLFVPHGELPVTLPPDGDVILVVLGRISGKGSDFLESSLSISSVAALFCLEVAASNPLAMFSDAQPSNYHPSIDLGSWKR